MEAPDDGALEQAPDVLNVLVETVTPDPLLGAVLRGLICRFRGPEFAELHRGAAFLGSETPRTLWQIPEADLVGMTSFTEEEGVYQ